MKLAKDISNIAFEYHKIPVFSLLLRYAAINFFRKYL